MINQARSVWIQIPSLGRRIIDVEVVGMTPDRDIALLRLKPEGKQLIISALGHIPYLELGDSDSVRRADEVLALGCPLGQQSLKAPRVLPAAASSICCKSMRQLIRAAPAAPCLMNWARWLALMLRAFARRKMWAMQYRSMI